MYTDYRVPFCRTALLANRGGPDGTCHVHFVFERSAQPLAGELVRTFHTHLGGGGLSSAPPLGSQSQVGTLDDELPEALLEELPSVASAPSCRGKRPLPVSTKDSQAPSARLPTHPSYRCSSICVHMHTHDIPKLGSLGAVRPIIAIPERNRLDIW